VTLTHPVLVTFDDIHFNFRSAITHGTDTSKLVLNSLKSVEQEMEPIDESAVFKATVRDGEARVDTNSMFERFVDEVRSLLELDNDEYFSDEE
jgi:hypothetical protein